MRIENDNDMIQLFHRLSATHDILEQARKHNWTYDAVREHFERRGVHFEDDLTDVPQGFHDPPTSSNSQAPPPARATMTRAAKNRARQKANTHTMLFS